MSIAHRLRKLEVEEWQRVHGLPPRVVFESGLVRLDRLPAPERAELEALLSRVFDDRGYLAPEQLTDAERRRACELIEMLRDMIE